MELHVGVPVGARVVLVVGGLEGFAVGLFVGVLVGL